VIDEIHDHHPVGELSDAAYVIAVIVGDDEVIDLLHAGSFGDVCDAISISAVEAWPAGIDEHGLSTGAYEQGRLSALDIDGIDLKAGLSLSECADCEEQDREEKFQFFYAHGFNSGDFDVGGAIQSNLDLEPM
jgi:hypothetical protein